MHTRVIALPQAATVLDACEFFVLHKLLAVPGGQRSRAGDRRHRRQPVHHRDDRPGRRGPGGRRVRGHRLPRGPGEGGVAGPGVSVPLPVVAGDHRQRSRLCDAHEPVRGDAGQEHHPRVLPGPGPRAGREREHPVDDGDDPDAQVGSADAAMVRSGISAGDADGRADRPGVRAGGRADRLALAEATRAAAVVGGGIAGALLGSLLLRTVRADGAARPEARPEDRRRSDHAGMTDVLTLIVYFGLAALVL